MLHGASASSGFAVLNFKSYMDETGIQYKDRFCTIGGYVGSAKVWDDLEYRWRWILNDYMRDIPEPKRYFHALEFYGTDYKYEKWKRSKRESFIDDLFRTINLFDVTPFSSTIDTQVFLSLTEDERRYLTGGTHNGMKWKTQGAPSKQYFVPFIHCVIQSADYVPDGALVFPIMSRQDQYKMKALELYDNLLDSYPPLRCRNKLADDMVFSDPKKVPALQAADLAVYWLGQLMKYQAKTGDNKYERFPHRVEMRKVLKNAKNPHDFKLFDFNGLMLVLSGAGRYIKTSFPTLDQMLPSLPVEKRKEILGVMRKVNFRPFLDHWQPNLPEGHG
jgi:hypothetical protein